MCLSNQLLKLWDEFYAAISPGERKRNQSTNLIFRKMRTYLDEGTDEFTVDQERMLIGEVKAELEELMEYVNADEKIKNPKLSKLFSEFQEHLDFLQSENDEGDSDDDEEDDDEDHNEMSEDDEWNLFDDTDEPDHSDWSDRENADDSENEEDDEW